MNKIALSTLLLLLQQTNIQSCDDQVVPQINTSNSSKLQRQTTEPYIEPSNSQQKEERLVPSISQELSEEDPKPLLVRQNAEPTIQR